MNKSNGAGLAVGAAVGVAVGLLANLARKALVQGPTFLGGEWDEALAKEHDAALSLIDVLLETDENDAGRRTVLLTQLKHALGKHAFQEENSVYPMLRDQGLLSNEEELTKEHAEVKFYLHRLTMLERSDSEWIALVRELRTALEAHMIDEETNVFPKLRSALSDEQNAALTQSMNREGFKLA